jgi:predicted amidohydrolase
MAAGVEGREGSGRQIERRFIDYVPEAERHGKVWHQGPFWFLGNFQLFTITMGFIGPGLGLMICFDVEFPEVARSLARADAELLVTISANMDPFGRDHDVFATALALENGLPHLYVNRVGRGEAFTFAGGTMAVSADGDRLAEAGESEGAIPVSLDPSARKEDRPEELRPRYLEEMRGALPVVRPGR